MIRFKPEVRIGYVDERLLTVLTEACLWSYRARVDVEVNSIEDAAPGRLPDSLHPFGLAIDLDTVGDAAGDLERLGEWMRRTLPPIYDVVYEGDHLHVEWDAHRPPFKGRPS